MLLKYEMNLSYLYALNNFDTKIVKMLKNCPGTFAGACFLLACYTQNYVGITGASLLMYCMANVGVLN